MTESNNPAGGDTKTDPGSKGGKVPAGTAADANKAGKSVAGIRGLYAKQWEHGKWLGDRATRYTPALVGDLGKGAAKYGGRIAPFVGNAISAGFAIKDFRNGDPVGGLLGVIGALPVVGYVGIGASICWEMWGPGGSARYERWAEPDGVRTHMLPAAAAHVANVAAFDAVLTTAQKGVFGFQDGPTGTVWGANPPPPLWVDTPAVKQSLDTWLGGIAGAFRDIETALADSGEPYMQEARTRLAAHLKAMRDLPEYGRKIETALGDASDAADDLYKGILDANADARSSLAAGSGLGSGDFSDTFMARQNAAATRLTNANDQLGRIAADQTLPPLAPTQRLMPPTRNVGISGAENLLPMPQLQQAQPVPALAASTTSAPATDKNEDDIADLLSRLGNNLGGTSLGGGMPGISGMPLGGFGGQPLGAGMPLNPPTPKPLAPEAKPVLGAERKNLSGAPPENKMVPGAAEKKLDEKKDEKRDGLVAGPPAAAAPEKPTEPKVKAASAKPEQPDTTVEVKGKQIQFPDAKTAALATELGKATPGTPVSIADAATKAGLVPPVPGQDPGQQVAPPDAKPGDLLVAGDKSYMLLGDGKFLDYSDGRVVDASQMPKDLGPKGGYFHLQDPTAGAQTGPVSGQAPATTTFTVDQGSAVGPPTEGGAAVPAPAAPAPASPGPTPAGVTSAGSPGVPSQGAPGSGPANAAATDTGRGVGVPVPAGQKPLDPTVIK